MASDPDQHEHDQGFHIDFPFVSFQIGRGGWRWSMEMNDIDDAYERARRRVRARLSFYRHLATAAAVMAAIIFIDLFTGGGLSSVVLWLTGIWGAILLWQLFNVFVFPLVWSPETEERMIQDELRRHRPG